MGCLGYLLVLTLASMIALPNANGRPTGAWTNAHATFYGESDASGTMGKNIHAT